MLIYYRRILTFVKMNYATYSSDAIEALLKYEEDISYDFRYAPDTLVFLTSEIWDSSFGFVRVGLAAELVKSRKLWSESKLYIDWKDYCLKALGKTAWSVNRTIDAAKVVMRLIDFGHTVLPTCEAQCRPLVAMMRNMCEGLHEAWEKVTGEVSVEGITAGKIDAIIHPDREPKLGEISKGTIQRLGRIAKSRGITLDNLLDELLCEVEETDKPESPPITPDVTPADFEEILTDLDLKFATIAIATPPTKPNPKPRSSSDGATNLVEAFDNLMGDLIGKFVSAPVGGKRKKASMQV